MWKVFHEVRTLSLFFVNRAEKKLPFIPGEGTARVKVVPPLKESAEGKRVSGVGES